MKVKKKIKSFRLFLYGLLVCLATLGLLVAGIFSFTYAFKVEGRSMLPTFNDGEEVRAHFYNPLLNTVRPIQKGDVVIFGNDKTTTSDDKTTSFIKRVVGTAGDSVEFKGGFLYVNGQLVEEPYVNKPRSTFENQLASGCKPIEIPKDSIFVLGDNRARSKDSRNLGPIPLKDIHWVLPLGEQNKYKDRWHDATKDNLQANLPTFDNRQYYTALNQIRTDNKLKSLKANTKLESAAQKRAEATIKFGESNINPDKSKYPPKQAQTDSGYFNIIFGETNTLGYFDSEDLANYWMDYDTKASILNKDYQDVGIGSAIGQINGCSAQVIVQEFGGYIPPNYKQTDIDNWQKSLDSLRNVLPSWENIKNFSSTYNQNKQDADRLLEIINLRISRTSTIVTKMSAQKWLTNEEIQWTYDDTKLYNEEVSLANKLNSITWRK